MAARHAALLEVALVIFFRAIEFAGRGDFRGNRALKFLAGLETCFGLLCDGFLFRRVRENRRAILRAEIRSLAIYLRRIVHVPERFDERFVAHLLRIKKPTAASTTPGIVRNFTSTPQKQPAAKVASSVIEIPSCSISSL